MDESTNKFNYSTPVAIVLAGLIIAAAVFYGNPKADEPITTNPEKLEISKFVPVGPTDHVQGDAKAKLAIVEYSDLECPFCKIFHKSMKEIMADKSVSASWTFRHFPIESLHSKAKNEAIAAECATVQGNHEAFWKYIDEIFKVTPSNNNLAETELPLIASQIGLNVGTFNKCLTDQATVSRINADYDSAIEIGVDGTPFVLVIKGNTAYPIFRYKSIDDIPDNDVKTLAEKIIKAYEKNITEAQSQ
ncbi:MAG: thioredoxin domain-containing protein [Patescibacteria group bacterium]